MTGCTRVSPGCAHCYIERTIPFRSVGRKFKRVGNEETTGITLHPDRLEHPLRWRRPRMIFVNSLSDLWHEEIPEEFVDRIFAVMALARWHSFQVLTKRPEQAREYLSFQHRAAVIHDTIDGAHPIDGRGLDFKMPAATLRMLSSRRNSWHPYFVWPLPNVWIGVSIENARYTWRADVLREIPAAVRFISAEPLLGSLYPPKKPCGLCGGTGKPIREGEPWCLGCRGAGDLNITRRFDHPMEGPAPLNLADIDWLIVGGESGPGARPMEIEWARELVVACRAGGVAPFVKQLGKCWDGRGKGNHPEAWPEDLRIFEFPEVAV